LAHIELETYGPEFLRGHLFRQTVKHIYRDLKTKYTFGLYIMQASKNPPKLGKSPSGEPPTPRIGDIEDTPERIAGLDDRQLEILIGKCASVHALLLSRLIRMAASHDVGRGSQLMLTVPDVAHRLKLRPAYVYELIRRGSLQATRAGKYLRVSEASLQAWQRNHCAAERGA
jgi:excisionase family DNA binding protein